VLSIANVGTRRTESRLGFAGRARLAGGPGVGTPPGRRRYEEQVDHCGDGKKRRKIAGLKTCAMTAGEAEAWG